MICSMALGGNRPLITIRLDASMEPVVPISASMKAKTWSCDRFSVLQMSPKLMMTTRFEPSRTTCGGFMRKRLRSPASSGLLATSSEYIRSSSSSYLYSRSRGMETKSPSSSSSSPPASSSLSPSSSPSPSPAADASSLGFFFFFFLVVFLGASDTAASTTGVASTAVASVTVSATVASTTAAAPGGLILILAPPSPSLSITSPKRRPPKPLVAVGSIVAAAPPLPPATLISTFGAIARMARVEAVVTMLLVSQ
mmetsp:Transcript_39893/g.125103  ORF Transcript_39893/g.125103 Transcript_39893/m.125103 type:complete len:254 (-) Transcript_39893:919-1680(-)